MRRKAFTIIELLIVIAIIGILATIVIINVSKAKLKANEAKIKNDLGSLRNAASVHLASFGNLSDIYSYDGGSPHCPLYGESIDNLSEVQQFKIADGQSVLNTLPSNPNGFFYAFQPGCLDGTVIFAGVLPGNPPRSWECKVDSKDNQCYLYEGS